MMDIEWWRNLIAADIYATLKQKEQELPVFHSQGFQLSARTYLVDWLSLVVEQLQLSSLTLHLAIFLLDFYMDSVDTDRYKLYLLAMTCLRVACKCLNCSLTLTMTNCSLCRVAFLCCHRIC